MNLFYILLDPELCFLNKCINLTSAKCKYPRSVQEEKFGRWLPTKQAGKEEQQSSEALMACFLGMVLEFKAVSGGLVSPRFSCSCSTLWTQVCYKDGVIATLPWERLPLS